MTAAIAPNQRQFTLNSREFYEAVCLPRDRPWIPNGALPREPRLPTPQVIVEKGKHGDVASADVNYIDNDTCVVNYG